MAPAAARVKSPLLVVTPVVVANSDPSAKTSPTATPSESTNLTARVASRFVAANVFTSLACVSRMSPVEVVTPRLAAVIVLPLASVTLPAAAMRTVPAPTETDSLSVTVPPARIVTLSPLVVMPVVVTAPMTISSVSRN